MKISEKIEAIRLQPEHIRLRWVWGSVAISMLFILGIWIFSMGSLFQEGSGTLNKLEINTPSITEQLQTLKEQAPSIKNLTDPSVSATGEGVSGVPVQTDFQYSAPSSTEEIPQASAYSELPTQTPVQ